MAIAKNEFSKYIKGFQFKELFNEMGWNNDRIRQPIVVGEATFHLEGKAEKRGFKIFTCEPDAGSQLPDRAARKKIEGKVTKLFQEHLIIFIDARRREQVWQLAVRKDGSPTKISEIHYYLSQDPECLYQRAGGLFFTLDEEEKVTIIDVTKKVAENFQQNNERVTKKFYDGFKKEHTAFLKFILGIDNQLDMDWYASLMLNRLMFCYFIQKKGFLDNNLNYLQDKLKACKEKKGKNKFYSFYRDFLLALFHKGLGAPGDPGNLEVEIGRVPYLNGGLFDEHEIEKRFKNISIEDKAFETLFNFFDEWNWHLDTRETASGRDINPDVIGYIFEKYINDRAQMGAYYTKEDITGYIAKNCIIPWLFDQVKKDYPRAFIADGRLWKMVKDSGDEYIYDAVKYGVPEQGGLFDDLPGEIRKGFAPDLEKKVVDGSGPWLWEMRESWNKPAPSEIALPTEIYREVIERRKRYEEIKSKIENGEIEKIDDFITYNLDIRQFAQDVIENTGDADFIRHFYKALSGITILDPTCGSGAFLFAAMNILETLYEACIFRMKNFIDENGKGKHRFFDEELKKVNAPEHPNLQYFIYKSIILNNLYGVDIMNEAVEIAKLRLFLKLVATVGADYNKPNLGLEPLPDVDFNIRTGNTLVGYATETQINEAFAGKFDFDKDTKKIKEECDIVERAFKEYKKIQLCGNADFEDFKKAKDDLKQRLAELREKLDKLLHKQHYEVAEYDQWLATHQPFHWYAEFYEIIHSRGGFDVVIGNPPYVDIKSFTTYQLISFETIKTKNLYPLVLERCQILSNINGKKGYLVPVSSISTEGYLILQKMLVAQKLIISSYDDRPAHLFTGLDKNTLSILLISPQKSKFDIVSSKLNRWSAEERDSLFEKLEYYAIPKCHIPGCLPKLGSYARYGIWQKMINEKKSLFFFIRKTSSMVIYYSRKINSFLQILDFIPQVKDGSGNIRPPSEFKELFFDTKEEASSVFCLFNSSLYRWFIDNVTDGSHLNRREINYYLFNPKHFAEVQPAINTLAAELHDSLKASSQIRIMKYPHDTLTVQCIIPKYSKSIIDRIDCLLAQHYGFTQEELDFIINYDIKYRMGKELESGE